MKIIHGDCLEKLKEIPDNSIDSIVTDPPYGLSFMGKKWDYDVPSIEIWQECLRVLKPGGHLLSFAGTRTQHRMAVRIEDAGFEIRDMIAWVYGSGFPKSLNIGKAVDKVQGVEVKKIGTGDRETTNAMGNGLKNRCAICAKPFFSANPCKCDRSYKAQNEWQGWGTALKPALEPITVARKPLSEKTVAENVLKHGTGGLNIDGSRVGTEDTRSKASLTALGVMNDDNWKAREVTAGSANGRWPANLLHDGSEEVLECFPNSKSSVGKTRSGGRSGGILGKPMERADKDIPFGFNDSGSAARFFYCAKENRSERWAYLTCNCETVKLDAWVKQDQNQEGLMGGMLQEVATSEKALTEDCSFSMSTSGKLKTEKSQKDTAFTTSTTINKTTGSKTYNSLAQQSTSDYTEDASLEEKNGGSHAQSAKDLNRSTPRIGTSHQRDGRCMGVVVPATSLESYRKSVCENCGGEVKVAAHPTQKPISLMRYLVKLVTPPGGTVLDPFTGSGSTGKACKLEGFDFIGIEREEEYVKIAEARIAAVTHQPTLV